MSQRFYFRSTPTPWTLDSAQGTGPNGVTINVAGGGSSVFSHEMVSGTGGPTDWVTDQNYSFSLDVTSAGANLTYNLTFYRQYKNKPGYGAVVGEVVSLTGTGIKTWSGLPDVGLNGSADRGYDDGLMIFGGVSNSSTMSAQSLIYNAEDADSWVEVPFDPGSTQGEASLSSDSSLTVAVRGGVDPSEGGGFSFNIIPLSNRYYAVLWEVPQLDLVNQDDGTRAIRLLRSTPEEDGFEWAGTISQFNRNNGIGNPMGAVRLSDTQLIYYHPNYYGLGNTKRLYVTGAALNENGNSSTLSNGAYGSAVITPVATTGGLGNYDVDRLTDKKFIVAAYKQTSTTPTWAVMARVGYLTGTDGWSPTFGTEVNLGDVAVSGLDRLSVVGLSDTRAAIVVTRANGNDRYISAKIIGISSGDTGTTVTDISGSWVDLTSDWNAQSGWNPELAEKLDSQRFVMSYSSRAAYNTTDRRLNVRVVNIAGDTFTVGNSLALVDRAAGALPQHNDFEVNEVMVKDTSTVLIAASRTGSDPAYGSVATSTAVGTNTMTITKPASTTDGNVLLAFFAVDGDDGTVTITPPSGWTLLKTERNSGNVGLHAYYKVANSEGANYVWGFSGNVTAVGAIERWTNSALDYVTPWVTSQTGSGTNPVAAFNYTRFGSVVVSATSTDVAHSPPAGYTERVDLGAGGTVRLSIADDGNTTISEGHSPVFTAASTEWATMHLRVPGLNSPEVGWIVDCGSSGTTATLTAEIGPLFSRLGRISTINHNYSEPALINGDKAIRGMQVYETDGGAYPDGIEFYTYAPQTYEPVLMHTHLNAGVLLG